MTNEKQMHMISKSFRRHDVSCNWPTLYDEPIQKAGIGSQRSLI